MNISKGIKLNSYIEVDEEIIKTRAYYIWENNGRPDGRSEEFFYQALNETFTEAKNKLIEDLEEQNYGEEVNWVVDVNEIDNNWFSDIEATMPEIRYMKFRNVSQKISWMFNNLKKFKPINKQENNELNNLNFKNQENVEITNANNHIELPENLPLIGNSLITEIVNEIPVPVINNDNVENVIFENSVVNVTTNIPQESHEEKVYNSLNDLPSITEDVKTLDNFPPSKLSDERLKEMYSVDNLVGVGVE